jgi:hypothetical protein
MPILNFPNNPSVGDTYTGDNGISYIWDGNKWGGHTAAIDTINTNSSYIINNGNVIQVDGSGNLVIPVGATILDTQGNQVVTGNVGATGVAGTNGATGVAGTNGATGVAGTNGATGLTGATGVAGTNGATGVAGTNGATGVAGTNGATGLTGATGVAGSGSSGTVWTNDANGCLRVELSSTGFQAFTDATHLDLQDSGQWNIGSYQNSTVIGNDEFTNTNILSLRSGDDTYITTNLRENGNHQWKFGTDGKLTLPTDGSIDTYSGTGGFKITTDGQIQFASGYSIGGSDTGLGLRMATDRGTILFGNHPETPTSPHHFHIMKQEPANVDLFFGDDYNYVKLPGSGETAYGVEIGTNVGSAYTWRFGTDGNLTLPNSTVIGTLSTGTSGIVAPIDTTFVVETNKSSVTTATSIINPGTGATPSNSTGTAGVRYVLGGPGGAGVGMQVRFTSGGYAGGQILNPTDIEIIDPGTGYQTGDQLTILNGNNDCSFTIQVTPQFNNTWRFGTDGSITFPDATTTTGKSITIPAGNSLTVDLAVSSPPTSTTFKVNPVYIKLPTGNGYIFSGVEDDANKWALDSTNKTLFFPDSGDSSWPQIRYSNDSAGMELFTGVKPIKITAGQTKSWTFGTDGNLTVPGSITFPDNTVQTTAYVTGNPLIWAATDNGHGSITQAVAYDSQGNSYSLISQGNINNSGVFPATIVKRSSTGSELWKIDLGTDHSVNPWSLVCDGDDNLYVIVQRLNGSVYNNVVLKLNGINGSILWQVDIQDSQDANNMQAVPFSGYGGMGPSSGVVVAGTAYNGSDYDFFITALGADGSFIATNTYGDQWDQQAYSVAINPMSLETVLVGCKKSNTDNAYYLEIIKFVSGAPPAWQKSITIDGTHDVKGTDVCLLPDGNWAVLATHSLANNNYGVITMKINNTDGSVMWSREISQGCTNISSSIATDSTGNIYMSAMTYSGNNTPSGNVPIINRLIGAYDTNGNALWQKYFRTFDTSEILVDPNFFNYIGSTGKQLAVYNDRLLVATSVVTLANTSPTGASAVVVQLTTQGENETIDAYETRNSYLTDSAVSLTVADTVFDYTTSTQTLSTGTSVSTTSSTLTFSLEHTGAYVSQLKNGGKIVALETNGTLLDGNGRNVTGEFDGVTDSGNNFSNTPIGIRNASGYKRLVGLTNSAQKWFDINDVATQLGVNPAWIMGVTIEYNVVSSNLNNNGSMTGQIIIASSNNSSWNISVSHSEAVLTTSNSSNDVVFANLNMWQPSGWTLQAVRTDSNSQQLDIIWTAKVFINASENYC